MVGVKYGRVKCPIWSFKTNGKDGVKCTFQADGNLVVYKADGSYVRSTESNDDTSNLHYLELTDSGELRIRSYNTKKKYSRITFSSFDPKWR